MGVSILLSFVIVGSTSALNENLTLGHFSISFNASEKAPFAKTCKVPTRIATADGIGMTNYQCGLRNSTGRLLAFTIGQYDVDRASKLVPHVSDKDTKLWLEGLICVVPKVFRTCSESDSCELFILLLIVRTTYVL